jgi:hypothetical protein
MPHAFLQLDNHSSKQTTYQPQAQISNHESACTQALLLYKMPHAFLQLDNHSSKYTTNLVRGSYERANSIPNNLASTYFCFPKCLISPFSVIPGGYLPDSHHHFSYLLISYLLKVHSHLVLGTLVLSSLTPW